jgi:hypothetical protein
MKPRANHEQTDLHTPLFPLRKMFLRRRQRRNKSPDVVVLPDANPHNSFPELIMKKIVFAALSVVVLAASSSAFAEGKTRAEVYQELIQAQQNGLDYITDSSYPDVSPVFAQQVQQRKDALAAQAPANRVANGAASAEGAN